MYCLCYKYCCSFALLLQPDLLSDNALFTHCYVIGYGVLQAAYRLKPLYFIVLISIIGRQV